MSRAPYCANSQRPVAEIGPGLQMAEPGGIGGSCGLLPWWGAGFRGLAAQEGFDDAHRATAFGACLVEILFLLIFTGHLLGLSCPIDQVPDLRDPVTADAIGKEASMADTVEAGWQDMCQEAADKLGRGQVHRLHPVSPLDPIVFPTERHCVRVGTDQAMVRDGDPVGIAAEICQHLFGASEGRFGIDDPVGLAQWGEMGCEGIGVRQLCQGAEEPQLGVTA